MNRTQVLQAMALGWRPIDIHHVQGQWPPRINNIPEGIAPAIAVAWAFHKHNGQMETISTPLVDAPLLAPATPLHPKRTSRLLKLLHHCHHSSTAFEAASYAAMCQKLARLWNIAPEALAILHRLKQPPPSIQAQRVLLDGPWGHFDGHMLRHLGARAGVFVTQLHPGGIWSLLGQACALQSVMQQFSFLRHHRWPGAHSLDPAQANSFCAGLCATPPTPAHTSGIQGLPARSPTSAVAAEVLIKMQLLDHHDPPGQILPAWRTLGARWRRMIQTTPPMLVELQA
ncbi:hypothetical protein [Corynebacterium pseudopelargi]|nr:hypothetical protein [Corynebacterium pseudopelargi]